jgi:cell division protein FtsB
VRGFWVVAALAVAAWLVAAFDEDAGLWHWLHLRSELADAHARIAELRRGNEAQRVEVRRLEADEFAIEKAIREELGLARPGQQLVRLPPVSSSSARIP